MNIDKFPNRQGGAEMTKKQRAAAAVEALKTLYPDAVCSLCYKSPFQLLVATRLSAQCTDKRVNMVTPALFAEFPDAYAMANARLSRIEELIRTCGLYKTKAKDLLMLSQKLCSDFGGEVPDSLEELITLPGIGRKTANLIMGDVYHKPAIVTDTHLIRLTNRLGLVDTKDPYKVEMALKPVLDPNESNDFCHRAVLFGRDICTARTAHCDRCPMAENICLKKGV